MSLLHAAGNTCAVSELDLHALPVTQKDIIKTIPITKTTNNALTDTTTSFDFTFEPSNNYTDLNEASLYLEYQVVQPDGTVVTAADEAAPVNNILHSVFSNVQMLVNGEKLTGNYEQYPYKSYITDLIATEYRDKQTRLKGCQKWLPDTAGQMDTRDAPNAGWFQRRADSAGPHVKSVVGKPHLDMLDQCKLLPSHCELRFIFERTTNLFHMQQAADQDYSIVIKKAEMTIRQVVVRDEVVEVHNKSVMDPRMGAFNYPISRSKVIKHTLPQGAQDYTFTLPDTTQIPSQLILGLVKESASAGSKSENPYNFKHYDIRETVVQFDHQKFEIKTNFTTGNVIKAYARLYSETGIQASGLDCGITLDDFKNGYTLLAFDLTADRTPEDARINLVRQGKVTLSLRFGTALPHPVSVICLSSYDNLIQLTADRLPVTDFIMS